MLATQPHRRVAIEHVQHVGLGVLATQAEQPSRLVLAQHEVLEGRARPVHLNAERAAFRTIGNPGLVGVGDDPLPGDIGIIRPTPNPFREGMHLAYVVTTPDELVYEVTRATFAHLPELRTLHLAFANVTAEEMLDQCLFAPVHPGAARYYREKGLPLPRRCPTT